MLNQTFIFLRQLWQLFEVSQIKFRIFTVAKFHRTDFIVNCDQSRQRGKPHPIANLIWLKQEMLQTFENYMKFMGMALRRVNFK